MLEQYIEMLKQAEMVTSYTIEDGTIIYDGEEVEVKVVYVPVDEIGNKVVHIFHKGTETLIDVKFIHVCTCNHH